MSGRVLASVDVLAEFPELAIIEVLDGALAVTANALLAAHAELGSGDFATEIPDVSVAACLADAMLTNLTAMQAAIDRYRAYVLNADARRRCAPPRPF